MRGCEYPYLFLFKCFSSLPPLPRDSRTLISIFIWSLSHLFPLLSLPLPFTQLDARCQSLNAPAFQRVRAPVLFGFPVTQLSRGLDFLEKINRKDTVSPVIAALLLWSPHPQQGKTIQRWNLYHSKQEFSSESYLCTKRCAVGRIQVGMFIKTKTKQNKNQESGCSYQFI